MKDLRYRQVKSCTNSELSTFIMSQKSRCAGPHCRSSKRKVPSFHLFVGNIIKNHVCFTSSDSMVITTSKGHLHWNCFCYAVLFWFGLYNADNCSWFWLVWEQNGLFCHSFIVCEILWIDWNLERIYNCLLWLYQHSWNEMETGLCELKLSQAFIIIVILIIVVDVAIEIPPTFTKGLPLWENNVIWPPITFLPHFLSSFTSLFCLYHFFPFLWSATTNTLYFTLLWLFLIFFYHKTILFWSQ